MTARRSVLVVANDKATTAAVQRLTEWGSGGPGETLRRLHRRWTRHGCRSRRSGATPTVRDPGA